MPPPCDLNMEATDLPESLVPFNQTARRRILEASQLESYRRENLISLESCTWRVSRVIFFKLHLERVSLFRITFRED